MLLIWVFDMSIHNKELWELKCEPGHVNIFRWWEKEVIFYQERENKQSEEQVWVTFSLWMGNLKKKGIGLVKVKRGHEKDMRKEKL